MKKLTLIAIFFILFFAACKKDKDFRDRYVGEYEGKSSDNTYSFPHHISPSDPKATLHLAKHPSIDNALIVNWARVEWPNGSGYYYDQDFDPTIVQNIIYLSDEGFLYLKNTNEYNLHKNCNFIEPDSLFVVIEMPYGSNNQYYLDDCFFQLKKK